MEKHEIETLIQFNFWADGLILEACGRLPPEKLTRKLVPDPGWGDLFGTLVHALDTLFGWRMVLQSDPADVILEPADFPDLAVLLARWESEKAAWLSYAAGLDAEQVNEGYGPDPQTGPAVWQVVVHVVGHGIQHRSEAAAVLTGYGYSPGELDFGTYLQEHPGNP